MKKYTDEELLNSIRRFRDMHGRLPKYAECRIENDLPSQTAFIHRWGSFNKALFAFGFLPRLDNVPIPRDIALVQLKLLAEKLKRTPVVCDLSGTHDFYVPSYSVYQKIFGSYRNAIREAGLQPFPIRTSRCYFTNDEAILIIRKLAAEKTGIPTMLDYVRANHPGHPPTSALVKRFGSWKKALKIAFPSGMIVRVPFSFLPVRLYLGLYRLAKRLRLIRAVESHLGK